MKGFVTHIAVLAVKREWAFVWLLIGATAGGVFLSVAAGQIAGTYFFWGVLGLILLFKILTFQHWRAFLTLLTAFASLHVFQSGAVVGYRSWFYLVIAVGLAVLLRSRMAQLRESAIIFWTLLLAVGLLYLPFSQTDYGFMYSKGQLLRMGAGLSAFCISSYVSRRYREPERLRLIAFLLFMVCSLSLFVPQKLSHASRLGLGIGMDPNGLGYTVIYAIFFGLLFLTFSTGPRIFLFVSLGIAVAGGILIETASRHSIVTVICMVGLYLLTDIRINKSIANIFLVLLVLTGLVFFTTSSQWNYLNARFNRAVGEEGRIDRVDHLVIAFSMASDHPLGLGGGGFKEYYREYSTKTGRISVFNHVDPHNLFAMVLADWGFFGFLLLAGGFVALAIGIIPETGISFRFKMIALVTFLMLVNAGMNLSPVFMSVLGYRINGQTAGEKHGPGKVVQDD